MLEHCIQDRLELAHARRQVLRCGMKMSQPRTLLVVIIALLLLIGAGFSSAQEVPCDNGEAASVIPTDDKGEPATSEQIEDTFRPTIGRAGITRCLRTDHPLVNHVIDYRDFVRASRYVRAFRNVPLQEDQGRPPRLAIKDSVLWSPRERIDLSQLGEERRVGHFIQWTGVVLGPRVSGGNTVFHEDIVFDRVILHGRVNFEKAQFNMKASFVHAVFNQGATFTRAQFRQRVDFNFVEFAKGGAVSFANSIFDAEATFRRARFTGPATFYRVRFNMGTSFRKAVFYKSADFEKATFGSALSFREATIQGRFRLVETTWEGRADFRRSMIAELDWHSENSPSTVKGVFDVREAELKSLTIKDVHFSDLADFSGATFGKTAPETEDKILFEDVIFERAADFLRAKFQSNAIFVDNRFRGVLDLTNASFETHARLCLLDNRISQLLMDRGHLSTTQNRQLLWNGLADRLFESRFRALKVMTSGEPNRPYTCAEPDQSDNDLDSHHDQLQKIYRSIESSFRNANDLWGENEAWYLRTVANRKAGGRFWDIVLGILLDLPSRYGIDYIRALVVSVLLVLLFWAVYWLYFRWLFLKKQRALLVINLAAPPDQRSAFRFRPFERLFRPTVRETRPLRPCLDALFLSCRAFFKLGLGSSYPPVLASLVYVEWVLGMFMLIHFLIVLMNAKIDLPFLGG